MGLFTNPLGHAGFPAGAMGTPSTTPSAVRAATQDEVTEGTRNDIYITPETLAAAAFLTDFASPPVGGFGSIIPRPVASTTLLSSGATTLASSAGALAKIGNATGKIAFFGSAGANRATQATITNNVTPGGTTGVIGNFTSLTTYSTDAPMIRNDIYQLSLALKHVIDALRSYGLLA